MDHAPGRYTGSEAGGRKKKVTDSPLETTAEQHSTATPAAAAPEIKPAASASPQPESETQPIERPTAESALTRDPEHLHSGIDTKASGTAFKGSDQGLSESVAEVSPRRTPNKITIPEPPLPKPDHFNLWLLAAGLVVAVVGVSLFLINAEDPGFGILAADPGRQPQAGLEQRSNLPPRADKPELPESVKKQLAEAEKIRKEVEHMKQLEREHQRTLEQAEKLKRERDAALAKARAEEEQRAREAERAKLAAEREQAATMALAAEKAAQAKRKVKALAEKKRLAEQKRKQEQLKLEQEAREQEKLRLEQKAIEQDRIRLEQEEAQRLAKELEQKAERDRAEQAAAEQARIQQAEKEKNAGFSADPCSGPSARFVSSCRK